MRLALFQPDIPQNAGAILRLGACLAVAVDVIEPCGFLLDDRHVKRSAMDYLEKADWRRHDSWEDFLTALNGEKARLILLTTKGDTPYTQFDFAADDVLLLGRESAGVPDDVHERADARLCIPLAPGLRSMNVATAAAMVVGEALRQTGGFDQ
jgi:tRNA (cytidine/uridine-2'-O-)-methyltransferase